MMILKCQLINFIDLSLNDKKMVLSWRNNAEIKKWMYISEEISLKEHLYFIEKLKKDASRKYFLLKKNNESIGVVDFTNIAKDTVQMGLYANPILIGVGKFLMETITEYAFNVLKVKKINAEVFCENQKAYSLYLKYNFKITTTKKFNNQEVICMELINENR